jgi:hypothetical protein
VERFVYRHCKAIKQKRHFAIFREVGAKNCHALSCRTKPKNPVIPKVPDTHPCCCFQLDSKPIAFNEVIKSANTGGSAQIGGSGNTLNPGNNPGGVEIPSRRHACVDNRAFYGGGVRCRWCVRSYRSSSRSRIQ